MKNDVRIRHLMSYSFKFNLTMKLTTILLLVSVFSIQANTYSQKAKITCNLENVKITSVFERIEKDTKYKFLYNHEEIDVDRIVSLKADKEPLKNILERLFDGINISFLVKKKQIILKKKENHSDDVSNSSLLLKNKTTVVDQSQINGTITDSDGQPLPGANVLVKGTTMGVVADFDGKYQLDVPANGETLVFSYLGFKTIEVSINGQSTINVTLETDSEALEEVVVVGYGSVKRKDLTGSVSQVKLEEITAFPAADVVQSLQGRASGIIVAANNGEPGGGFKVRIRGATSVNASSDPLYVVDGFPGAVLPVPEDISSIEVLKDASSTAIYGSRGSNGVIIVTTKKGKSGKPKISFNASTSIQKETSRLDLLNAAQYVALNNEVTPGSTVLTGVDTDWQDEIFKQGIAQNYQLSFSGGTDNVNYYVSGVYFDQAGIVIGSNFKRYSVLSNINIKASQSLDFGINLMARRSDKDGVNSQEHSAGAIAPGVISSALIAEPTLPIFDEDGNYSISNSADPRDHAVASAREYKDEDVVDLVQANFFGNWAIHKDLRLRMNFGANIENGRQGLYAPTSLMRGSVIGGEGFITGRKYTALLNENFLTYTKSLENHDFTLMGGYSYQTTSSERWRAGGQSLLTDSGFWWGLSGASVANPPTSGLSETVLSSFYGRLNYKLFDRYLVTLSSRYDGSSRFSKNNKWAFFPSAAVAWNVKEESFLVDSDAISQLKFRASYGVTGSQSISPYQSLAELKFVHSVQNSALVNAVRPSAVANDNLTWESTTQTDFGMELGLFNHRVTLVADVYKKVTDDLIFAQPLPAHSGYSSFLNNIGSVQNKGLDFTLSTTNFDGEDFRWTSDFNFSRNRNEVLELPDENDIRINSGPGHMVGIEATSILRVGEPVGSYYGYVYDGVYQQGETILPGNFDQFEGGEKMKDVSGPDGVPDGEITPDDRIIIGNPNPDFFWGFNNDFTYKNFDMNIFFVGSQGNDIYSFTLMELETLRGISNSTTQALNRWTPTNTNTDIPVANTARGYHSSSRWVFDGSYVRLRNIALGYTLPESLGFDKVRVYISGQNLLTFTDYRGFDPEVNFRTGGGASGNLNVGLDYGSYPNAKSFTLGLNITF